MFGILEVLSFPLPSFSLPAVALPANLSRRFFSFILKRTLGHLVKPGQLDINQLEAQLGGGKFEIRDVELDPQAINQLLEDLPLQLHEGSIGKVAAQIPLPNIFTAPFNLVLSSLHLTLELRPPPSSPPPPPTNLAESVASIAESFVHDELDERDTRQLRQSVHGLDEDDEDERQPPGSINPYLDNDHDEEKDGDVSTDQLELEGVGMFSVVVERLLSRFCFTATDTVIKIVHPDVAEYTLRVPNISYATEEEVTETVTKVRTVKVSGVTVSVKQLRPPRNNSTSSTEFDTEGIPSAAESSSDDEVPMEMYQSTLSIASSVYKSAASFAPTSMLASRRPRTTSFKAQPKWSPVDETIISLASEPIVIKVRNVFPAETAAAFSQQVSSTEAQLSMSQETVRVVEEIKKTSRMSVDIGLGPVGAALQSRHIHDLLSAVAFVSSNQNQAAGTKTTESSTSSPQVQVAFKAKGLTLLLLQDQPPNDRILERFFGNPSTYLVQLRHLRLHIDNIEASLNDGSFNPASLTAPMNARNARNNTSSRQIASLSISDISLFIISQSNSWTACPIIIHDSNLPHQYNSSSASHPYFPVFDSPDWRKAEGLGVKSSKWKVVLPSTKKSTPALPLTGGPPAIRIRTEVGTSASKVLEVNVEPLHVFIDLSNVKHLLPFVTDCLPTPTAQTTELLSPAVTPDQERKLQSTPKARNADDRIIGDLDAQNAKSVKSDDGTTVILSATMIRIEVRCPAPPLAPAERSGPLVIDIHSLRVVTGDSSQRGGTTRFGPFDGSASVRRSSKKKVLSQVEWKNLIVSLAGAREPRASAIVFIAPQSASNQEGQQPEVKPVVFVRQSRTTKEGKPPSTSIEIRVPYVAVNLDKSNIDSLQLWADDCTQWAERTFGDGQRTPRSSAQTSIIGSKYFTHTPKGAESLATIRSLELSEPNKKDGEFVVHVSVEQASIQLLVPRGPLEGTMDARPFLLTAFAAEASFELKPEGRNETVLNLRLEDVMISDTSETDREILLSFLEPINTSSHKPSQPPLLQVRIISTTDPQTAAKRSTIHLTATGFIATLHPNLDWIKDLARFVKAPPGAFESVVPNEKTGISVDVKDGSLRVLAPEHKGALVTVLEELKVRTQLVTESTEIHVRLQVPGLGVYFVDDAPALDPSKSYESGTARWKENNYALIADLAQLETAISINTLPVSNAVDIERLNLALHLCADTGIALGAFAKDLASAFKGPDEIHIPETPKPRTIPFTRKLKTDLLESIDEHAFAVTPEVDVGGDFIQDDLPTNTDFLDAAYGTSGGVTAYSDDEFDDMSSDEGTSQATSVPKPQAPETKTFRPSRGETVRIISALNIVEDFFTNMTPLHQQKKPKFDYNLIAKVRAKNCEIKVHLHDGYDWMSTRKAIEEEVKAMRIKLIKLYQILDKGQVPDDSMEEAHAVLFNSVHIGLPQNAEEMDRAELMAAIKEEFGSGAEDASTEAGTVGGGDDNSSNGSWQSMNRQSGAPRSTTATAPATPAKRIRGKKLTRSIHPRINVCLYNVEAEVDQLHPHEGELMSRVLVKIRDLDIEDRMPTSTWDKFLTGMKSDAQGNKRETDSYMAKVELKMVKPALSLEQQEARLRMKFLPLRLRVDQDALDFLKAFGSFSAKVKNSPPSSPAPPSKDEFFFQYVEVSPVALKLDYKPKRVDYKALREGRTIELMNFFHFDGAEMTLRRIELSGIQGWETVGNTLNDLWTPDVKANQLVDVISGIAPIRSVVNVGSGFADLVLIPIAQYRKDGRVVKGIQRGATSFVKTTALEAVKLGAKLATGTQVILEEAENLLGPGAVVVETLEGGYGAGPSMTSPRLSSRDTQLASSGEDSDPETSDLRSARGATAGYGGENSTRMVSKYADQPTDVRQGMEAAYKSLGKNLTSAARTILAVPMEVYERSGNEGAARKVIRAVPIAVLKPMIGATEAVSKTLLGLRNTLDPDNLADTEEKYKR